jgi:DnaJ-domain-containing protein 1
LALGCAVCMALMNGAVEADELVLPYTCTMDRGVPRLTPSEANTYRIFGHRDDLPFTSCRSSAAWTCETMMVHKFTTECGGQRVAWAKIAASARGVGIVLPGELPPGYAPVSKLKGRLVLPGFGKTTSLPQVVSQTLSPDAVIEPAAPRPEPEAARWVTVVDPATAATVIPTASVSGSGGALKVAGVISTLLASLMVACLLLVRRRQFAPLEFATSSEGAGSTMDRIWGFATKPFSRGASAFQHSYESWRASAEEESGDGYTSNALAVVHARLHETEIIVSMLPTDLLLRDVLASELDSLHDRTADLGRRVGQLGPERVKSAIRAVVRDLDRIARIAQGAMPASMEERAGPAEPDAPATVFEAYRVLGLNPNAPDAAVKKIVDALRMSWHPDHARDEADRRYREQRIKQINAAWDLLKDKPAAAA